MAHVTHYDSAHHHVDVEVTARDPVYQAYQLLHVAFVLAPILAGVDKFFGFMVDWHIYLAPAVPDLLGLEAHTVMQIVGGVEIAAGLLVAFAPHIGGYVVAAWLGGIIANLLAMGDFYDIALRDLGLLIGALALGRLGQAFHRRRRDMR